MMNCMPLSSYLETLRDVENVRRVEKRGWRERFAEKKEKASR
jgi:hypothetical protein